MEACMGGIHLWVRETLLPPVKEGDSLPKNDMFPKMRLGRVGPDYPKQVERVEHNTSMERETLSENVLNGQERIMMSIMLVFMFTSMLNSMSSSPKAGKCFD
eukprot:4460715-Amphidinium_carterae.1